MLKPLMMLGAIGAMAAMSGHHPKAAATTTAAGPRPAVIEAAAPSPSPVAGIIDAGRSLAGFLADKTAPSVAAQVQASAPAPTATNLAWSAGTTWKEYYPDEHS